ncbi:MAG: hypothetical protein ACRDSN_17250, partial [Pseudonocardiaceae bacterium]
VLSPSSRCRFAVLGQAFLGLPPAGLGGLPPLAAVVKNAGPGGWQLAQRRVPRACAEPDTKSLADAGRTIDANSAK